MSINEERIVLILTNIHVNFDIFICFLNLISKKFMNFKDLLRSPENLGKPQAYLFKKIIKSNISYLFLWKKKVIDIFPYKLFPEITNAKLLNVQVK